MAEVVSFWSLYVRVSNVYGKTRDVPLLIKAVTSTEAEDKLQKLLQRLLDDQDAREEGPLCGAVPEQEGDR